MAKPDHRTWYVGSQPTAGFWAALSFVAGPMLLSIGHALRGLGRPSATALLVAGAVISAVALLWAISRLRVTRGEVRIDERGVHLGSEIIPRASIGRALFLPTAGLRGPHVALRTVGGARLAEIGMQSEEHARRFLETLALAPRPEAQLVRGVSPLTAKTGGALFVALIVGVGLALAGAILHVPFLFPVGVGLAVIAALALSPATFFVGADGVRVTTRLEDRFVSWNDVQDVRKTVRGLQMDTRRGPFDLSVTSHFSPSGEHEKVAHAALWSSVQGSLAAFRTAATSTDAAETLARRGRPFEEWQRSFAPRDGEGDFRTATLDENALWSVVESVAAKPTARAAAAALLAERADEPARARLRVAGEASAAPRLRVVLDEAARGASGDEIARALAEVADEDERAEEAKRSGR